MTKASESRPVPALHAIAGPEETETPEFPEVARRLQEACGAELALHLRLPGGPGRRLYELALRLSAGARETGGWCVVNERADVALAAGAQAVQVGRRALPLEEVRRLAGDRLRIGASVHGAEEAVAAVRLGANYALLGTIYPTPSHPGRPGAGPGLVAATRRALEASGMPRAPLVAIGGIRAERTVEVRAAGADGVAVRRAVWGARDPVEAARELLARMRDSC